MSELFPTKIRAGAIGVLVLLGRFGGAVCPFICTF